MSPEGGPHAPDGSSPLGPLLRDLAAATLHLHAAAADRAGIAPTDLAALHQLAGGSLTHRELSERLGLRPASTTAVVERLVGRGHAERHRSPVDGRSVLVSSTDEGRTTARAALGGVVTAVRRLGEDLGSGEHAVVARFLAAGVAAVSAAAGRAGHDPSGGQHCS